MEAEFGLLVLDISFAAGGDVLYNEMWGEEDEASALCLEHPFSAQYERVQAEHENPEMRRRPGKR